MTLARVESGMGFGVPRSHGSWILIGPFCFELHRWWFRVGVCASTWYVGVYLGFFVVTVGKRQWAEPVRRQTGKWAVTQTIYSADTDVLGAIREAADEEFPGGKP